MGKKLKIILPVLVVLLVISVIIGWQIIKSSPQYSIYQVYQAVGKHDYDKFKKYVDVEGVSNNVIDKALASATEETKNNTSNDPFYQLGQTFAMGLITAMKPRLKEEIVSGIQKAVEQGNFKTEYQPKNVTNFFSLVEVKKNGKVADVVVKAQGKDDLKLKMREMSGYWQIFDMDLPVPKTDTANGGSQDAKTLKANFGERTDITQGWFLIVEAPEEYEPTGYSTPKEGNKYVAAKVTYENTTDKPNSYSTYNFKLKDNKDFSYSDTYGGKEPRIDSGDLEAKGKVTGYMTFEIPKGNEPVSIIYSGSKSIVFTAPNPSSTP